MAEKIKTDIFSGFLGAGKTTLIKKLIKESYRGEKVVLIENEFGEIGIDGGFLADAGITVNEMNSGCICCSLVGDFGKALRQVIETYSPERILIEPSGVGKLSDIIRAVENLHEERLVLNGFATVADAKKCRMYMRNFGEFFNDQIENAGAVILSHTAGLSKEKIDETAALIREHNPDAVIVSTDWDELTGDDILAAMEKRTTIEAELKKLAEEVTCPVCGHHHDECGDGHGHEHHHNECCGGHDHEHHHDECGGHDHEHHHNECCGGHDHEHHHDECDGHGHEHHHDGCCDGHDHEHHHGHHHADEVFTSCGFETAHTFTAEGLSAMLEALGDEALYGTVLRAKGIVASADGGAWLHFDYVPGEPDIRRGPAAVTGRLCIIGAGIDEERLKALFAL